MQGCEREVREATDAGSEDLKKECLMRLSWALVHSRQTEDVQRGIAMLEGSNTHILFCENHGLKYWLFKHEIDKLVVVAASLENSAPPLQDREKLYLLAVGYYRSGDYSKSRQLVDRCIEVLSTS